MVAEFSSNDDLYTWTCVSRAMARLVSNTYIRRMDMEITDQFIKLRAYDNCKALAVWRRSHLYLAKKSLIYNFMHDSPDMDRRNQYFALQHFSIRHSQPSVLPSFRSIRVLNLCDLSIPEIVIMIGHMDDAGCESVSVSLLDIAYGDIELPRGYRRLPSIKTLSINCSRSCHPFKLSYILECLELPSLEGFDFWGEDIEHSDLLDEGYTWSPHLNHTYTLRWAHCEIDRFWQRHPHVKLGLLYLSTPSFNIDLAGEWFDRVVDAGSSPVDASAGVYGDMQYVIPYLRGKFKSTLPLPSVIGIKIPANHNLFHAIRSLPKRRDMRSGHPNICVTVDFQDPIDNIAEQPAQWQALADPVESSLAGSWRHRECLVNNTYGRIMTPDELKVASLLHLEISLLTHML